ncbi:MAG: hypothetical protein E6G51_02885 [Actinobacteria bacterium]|nr:MAG: hypothetical protein E6G51_02885 [Actinomycetota bacterium]
MTEADNSTLLEEWAASPELRAVRSRIRVLAVLGGMAGVATVVLWAWIFNAQVEENAYSTDPSGVPTITWIAAAVAGVAAIALGLVLFVQREAARRKFEERLEQEQREQLRADRDEQISPGELGELLAANRALLDEYQKPVRAQARTSYLYAQIAILIGLAVLVIGAVMVLVTGEAAARISVASLAAVGVAISGYVARTYLRVYDRAQEQLNYYFREPLVTSYLLTAERLAEKLRGGRRQRAYASMVEEIVRFVRADLDQGASDSSSGKARLRSDG